MGGVLFQMGHRVPTELQHGDVLTGWCARLMRANEVNPDPNTAMVVASSALLGLATRSLSGKGQQIFVDMFGANAYANHDDFLDFPGKPERILPDADLYGLGPHYRLYPCAAGQWIFLALIRDTERDRFHEVIRQQGFDLKDLSADSLTTLFATQYADFWESLCLPHGIGCVRADRYNSADFWRLDARVAHATSEAQHPDWGPYRRHGANVTFNAERPPLAGPPGAGEHSKAVLTEIGYDAQTIEMLYQQGVVWSESYGKSS